MRLLCINPGSTSTKIGAYEDENEIGVVTLKHDAAELNRFSRVTEQLPYRMQAIRSFLDSHQMPLADFSAFVGRGGLLRPLQGGTYRVGEAMRRDLSQATYGEHASNLGALLAYECERLSGQSSFIADPVVVDELEPSARFSGMPEIKRRSIFHALNQKAVARLYAAERGLRYEELKLIVCHMGGGITVGCHRLGWVIDVNNALDGDGPFSPERAGGMPTGQLADLCYGGSFSHEEMKRKITGGGGLSAYLGTSNALEIEERIRDGDDYARQVYDAMIYQIAKEIGGAAVVLEGESDAVLLTGGLAKSDYICTALQERVSFLAPVRIYPGEHELEALAAAGLRVLRGEEKALDY